MLENCKWSTNDSATCQRVSNWNQAVDGKSQWMVFEIVWFSFQRHTGTQMLWQLPQRYTSITRGKLQMFERIVQQWNIYCIYLAEIASPLNRKGQALKPDKRYNYYAKMCLPADAINKCQGYVTRFTRKSLIGMNDAKLTTGSYPECVKGCLTAKEKLGFACLSGMFYNNATVDNCLLNYADHYQEPDLFIAEPDKVVDYFSVKSCH